MFVLLSLAALLLGAGLSIQAGINSSLRSSLGHPLHARITNFLVGIVAVFAVALATGLRTPTAAQFGRTSWWMYLGGIVGAVYVGGSVALAPGSAPPRCWSRASCWSGEADRPVISRGRDRTRPPRP